MRTTSPGQVRARPSVVARRASVSAAADRSASTPTAVLKATAMPLVWSTSMASSAPGMDMTSARQPSIPST